MIDYRNDFAGPPSQRETGSDWFAAPPCIASLQKSQEYVTIIWGIIRKKKKYHL